MLLARNKFLLACLSLAAALLSLQQTSAQYPVLRSITVSTTLYTVEANNGITTASNYTLTYTPDETSRGILDLGNPGFNVNLSVGNASYSDIYGRAGCFNVTLSPTGPGIRGQVLTYSSGQANTQGSITRPNLTNILEGSNITAGDSSPHLAAADPNSQYRVLAYNLGDTASPVRIQTTALTEAGCSQIPGLAPVKTVPYFTPAEAPSSEPAANNAGRKLKQLYSNSVQYSYAPRMGPNLTEQYASSPQVSPAPGPSAPQTDSVQLSVQRYIQNGQYIWLGAFTNISCLAYKLMGLRPDTLGNADYKRLDLEVFALDEENNFEWASQKFGLPADNVTFQAISIQNVNLTGDKFNHLDDLDSSKIYHLWVASGYGPKAPYTDNTLVDVAYTAQSSGSCSNNLVGQYQGSTAPIIRNAPPAYPPPRPPPPFQPPPSPPPRPAYPPPVAQPPPVFYPPPAPGLLVQNGATGNTYYNTLDRSLPGK